MIKFSRAEPFSWIMLVKRTYTVVGIHRWNTPNGACAHYVMVSKFQWKPFWLATQRDPQNDLTAPWRSVSESPHNFQSNHESGRDGCSEGYRTDSSMRRVPSACEAAVHSMERLFQDDETRVCSWWMPLTPLTPWIDLPHCTISRGSALLLLRCSPTPTRIPSGCLFAEVVRFLLVKLLAKVILWPWRSKLWPLPL